MPGPSFCLNKHCHYTRLMEKILKVLKSVDWLLAIGTVVVGLVLAKPIVVAAGALGVAVAWYSPAERIKRRLEKKFLRKSPAAPTVTLDEAIYEQTSTEEGEPQSESNPQSVSYSASLVTGGVYLHSSPHNLLKPQHLALQAGARREGWA